MRDNLRSLTRHAGACILTVAAAGPVGAATGTTSGPAIEHTSARCVAPGRYPRIDARITSTGEVRAAHVVFRAAHSGSWYAVDMQAGANGTWAAALPRPKDDAGRLEYAIVASGPGGFARLPATGSFSVVVTPGCAEDGGLPVAVAGPLSVGLLGAADPQVPDFDVRDVPGRITGLDEELLAAANGPGWIASEAAADRGGALPLVPLQRVRLSTVAPRSDVTSVREDRRSVTFLPEPGASPLTLAKPGETLEGKVEAVADGVVVLLLRNVGEVRVREQDVVGISVHREGSADRKALGGLAGFGAGFAGWGLLCAYADLEGVCGRETLLVATGLGAALGVMAGGGGEWTPAPLGRGRHVSFALQPLRRGAAARVRVSF